jgi:hypothetical protein
MKSERIGDFDEREEITKKPSQDMHHSSIAMMAKNEWALSNRNMKISLNESHGLAWQCDFS